MTLAEAVALILHAFEEREVRASAPAFYDVDRSELVTGNAAREAWRRGELRLFRIGKRLLVDADELHGWIRRHEVKPTIAPALEPLRCPADDVDEALAAGGMMRRSG